MEYLLILPSLFQKNKSANFDTRPWQFVKFAISLAQKKYPKSPMCPFLEIPKTCHVTLENTILSVPWQIYFSWEHGRFPFCTMANILYVSWQFSFCSDHGKFNFFTIAIFSCYHGKFIFFLLWLFTWWTMVNNFWNMMNYFWNMTNLFHRPWQFYFMYHGKKISLQIYLFWPRQIYFSTTTNLL